LEDLSDRLSAKTEIRGIVIFRPGRLEVGLAAVPRALEKSRAAESEAKIFSEESA